MKKTVERIILAGILVGAFSGAAAFAQTASAPAPKAAVKAAPAAEEDEIGAYRRKRVEVIQDRLYSRRNKAEFSLMAGAIPDNNFYFYTAINPKLTYHFTEYLGVEGDFVYYLHNKKDLLKQIEKNFNQTVKADILNYYYGGEFIFTPLYGKLAFLTKDILHWDFFVAIGVGAFDTEIKTRFAGNFGVGMHVIFNKWLAGRFDFRNYTYRETINYEPVGGGAAIKTGSVVNTRSYLFGVSAFLPPL